MRPTYETSEDLLNEKDVIEKFCGNWINLSFAKLPKQYHLDYCLMMGDSVTGFCEVKVRKNNHNRYSTYILSVAKVSAAKNLQDACGLSSVLIVKWTDKIGYASFKYDWPVFVGGRKDRGDWQDVEPVAHIPLSDFKYLD